MKQQYIVAFPQRTGLEILPVEKTKPGGWYLSRGTWYGPGVALHVFEIDSSERSSKGNPEFSPGDLVEVFFWGQHKQGIYVKTLSGRKTAEVLIEGTVQQVLRDRVSPFEASTDNS